MPDQTISPDTFLLNPQNANVLRGERKRPLPVREIVLFLVGALILLGVDREVVGGTVQYVFKRLQLQFGGVQTQATILGLDTIVTYVRGRPSENYAVSYTFDTDNSLTPTYSGSAAITEETYQRLREGDTILIRYLPSNPHVSSPVSDVIDDSVPNILLSLIFVGLELAGVYALFAMWRENRRLFSQGRLIAGEIRSAHGSNRKGVYQVTIHYAFRPRDDQEIEAYQTQNRKDLTDATLPAKGAPVAVLYVDDKLYRLL